VIHSPVKAIGEIEAVVADKGYHLIIFDWHINLPRITIPYLKLEFPTYSMFV
jgi:hypothetical protein